MAAPPMSRTLFWYIFRDLVKVFLLANGVLAGIMSFGGLLKPLTRHGLDGGQVAQMLAYAMPAMTTYSLPVAVLFACTFVYGRLAADNELVACRAAGVSMLAAALPGVVLGLIVALVSVAMLSVVVPAATLAAERVVYSNLAQLAANEIRRQNKIDLGGDRDVTLYAQDAQVVPTGDGRQAVALAGVSIVRYDDRRDEDGDGREDGPPIVRDIYLAGRATAYIDYAGRADKDVQIAVALDDGTLLPRSRTGTGEAARQVAFKTAAFPPYPLPSPLKEKTKFMDLRTLRALDARPRQSRDVGEVLTRFVRGDQRQALLEDYLAELRTHGETAWRAADGDVYRFAWRGLPGDARVRDGRLKIGPAADARRRAALVQSRVGPDGTETIVRTALAASAEVSARMAPDGERAQVAVELADVVLTTPRGSASSAAGGREAVEARRASFREQFDAQAPAAVRAMNGRDVADYLQPDVPESMRRTMAEEVYELRNGVRAEVHARFSFAVSCAGLALVGTALGMIFKTGNVLTAFGVSMAPAVVGIVMVVAGQHVAENVPKDIGVGGDDPLALGLGLIWAGNLTATALGAGLLAYLWRR